VAVTLTQRGCYKKFINPQGPQHLISSPLMNRISVIIPNNVFLVDESVTEKACGDASGGGGDDEQAVAPQLHVAHCVVKDVIATLRLSTQ
jgi:hypothetical protein